MLSYKFVEDDINDDYESNLNEYGSSSINKFSKFNDDDED
jgi:agmatinase